MCGDAGSAPLPCQLRTMFHQRVKDTVCPCRVHGKVSKSVLDEGSQRSSEQKTRHPPGMKNIFHVLPGRLDFAFNRTF